MTKSSTTPIVMLTLQDLRDVIREEMGSSVNVTHESEMPSASQHVPAKLAGKEVVFGLAGICKIFNCKMSRAQKLKNTIIKDAVHQNGRTIITDVQNPTNDDQLKKAADNLLERIDWKGTYQSSYELAVSRTEDLSNEISVSSQLLENLILAAGGRGVTGSGGGGSNNELTNWDGTKKNTGWSRSR